MRTLLPSDHVVVVGAGFGGWRLVEALRRDGFEGELTMLGDESHVPYDRPPLSKQVLSGKWDVAKTTLATPELIAKNDVTLRLGSRAVGLDVEATTVHLDGGDRVEGTHVVIATGSRARRLPFSAGERLHTLRGRDDLERLSLDLGRLEPGSIVAIVGGGFIGAEAATALRARSLTPIVLEGAARPLHNVLGERVSGWLADLALDADVELRNAQHVVDVLSDGDRLRVSFADGGELVAREAIVAVGAVVNDEWLSSSGLVIDNGVVVDADLLATERVGAIGDVARFAWRSVTGEELVRIEHWQVANDHAAALARFWTKGERSPALLVPYFWSDQYGKRIQMLGHPRPDDDVVLVSGSVAERKWVAVYSREGVVTGVVALSHPRALMLSKHLLDAATSLGAALDASPWAG